MIDGPSLKRRIGELLRARRPFAYCDACLARELGSALEEVASAAQALATEGPAFRRERRLCYRCHRTLELTSPV